jgi:tetratricopeptide (TPR) repeat protein
VLEHDSFADPVKMLRGYIKDMDAAGVPKEDRTLVMLFLDNYLSRAWEGRTKYASPPEIVEARRTARSLPVRQWYLLDQVCARAEAKDVPGMRAAADAYLATYHSDRSRYRGRRLLVASVYEMYNLGVKRPDELLALVRAWRDEKAKFNETEALQAVAGLYEHNNNAGRAAETYHEAVRVAPSPAEAAWPKFALAQLYRKEKDEKNLLPVLRDLAELKPEPNQPFTPYARHAAREILADYHFDRKEWKEALAIYEVWDHVSGCGLGAIEGEKKKAARIAECRKQLGVPQK